MSSDEKGIGARAAEAVHGGDSAGAGTDNSAGGGGDNSGGGGSDEPADGWTLKDLLLSDRPNLQPEVLGRAGYSPAEAHVIIAARKMLSVILPATTDVRGTPAIQNLGTAAWYYYIGAEWDFQMGGQLEPAEGAEQREQAADEEPAEAEETVTARTPEEAEAALAEGKRVSYEPGEA